MSGLVTRRLALKGTAAAALGLAAGVVQAATAPDEALIAQAESLKVLRARELQAWVDLVGDPVDDDPAYVTCCDLSTDICTAGEALAETPARTPDGIAAKASAMLALVGRGKWAETEAFSEHHRLVAAVLRDAARLGPADGRALQPCAAVTSVREPLPTAAERRLGIVADHLDTLQARADRNAAGAGADPADPYTLTVAEIDLVAAGMAAMPADTMGGVVLKLRAMAVPIVLDDGEARVLAVSVCRDLRRLYAAGRIADA